MQTHKIKLRKEFCNAVYEGYKNFEIRYNDRGYQKGDIVNFIPVDETGVEIYHAVKEVIYRITYVMNGWGLQDNYVVFGIVAEVER